MPTIDENRRSAAASVRARERAPWGAELPFLVLLRWHGDTWLTPFPTPRDALAYFARADETGIDYDYGACFDVASDASEPRLIWDMPGKSSDANTTTTSGGSMHGLIGRGHHGGGHGGHGGGRRPGIRRNFGGGGWYGYWPYWPYYYPGYDAAYDSEDEEIDVISGAHRHGGGGVHRHRRRRQQQPDQYGQFDQPGAPYGAPPIGPEDDDGSDPDTVSGARLLASADNELVSTLPVLAPGANGLTCQIDLSPDLQLHVRICVDGRCYETATDVSQAMGEVAQDVASEHDGAHLADGRTPPPIESSPAATSEMARRADGVVKSAGVALIGALYDQHLGTVSGGWFDSIKDAVRVIASPVTVLTAPIVKEVGNTLKNFKGPISTAAGAIATAYGGPAAGAAAAQLTGPLVDSMAETGGDPTQFIDGILSHAGGDPVVHQAVADAQQAVSHATAAYHLTSTAQDAARGDPHAGRKIAELDSLATGGDRGAVQAMMIIAQVFQAMMGNAANAKMDDLVTSGTLPRQSRALADQLRGAASKSVQEQRAAHGMTVLGYVKYADSGITAGPAGSTVIRQDTEVVAPFDSVDQADDWMGQLDSGEILYAAYFDASDPLWPHPLNEKLGYRRTMEATATGGFPVLPLVAAAAAGAGGAYAWQHYKAARAARQAAPPTTSGSLGILPWLAMAAAGGAGWTGRGWWEQRKAAQAAAAAAAVPPPNPSEPPVVSPPHGAMVSGCGWW